MQVKKTETRVSRFKIFQDLMRNKAHRAGYQVSVHACGARRIEQVLNTYEEILKNDPRDDHRHRLEHFETPSASQLRRVARAGVSASMHPQHNLMHQLVFCEHGEAVDTVIIDGKIIMEKR